MLLFAVALAASAAVPATAHSDSPATGASQRLADLWALEVTPKFAPLIRPRLVADAKKRGINTVVLNRHLSQDQKRRVRLLARRFHLRVLQPRLRVCKHEVKWCAVVARRPAAVGRLSRMPHVDIVVLRLRGPGPARRLTQRYVRAANGTASARLLLLPRLGPRFSRAPWRRAISAVADVRPVDLGVTPSGRSSRRAFKLFLDVLSAPPPSPPGSPPTETGSIVFRGDFETGDHSQWTWGAQCANTGVPSSGSTVRGTITVQSEIVSQGTYAARFHLPAGDAYSACETLDKRRIDLGTDDYYGLMVRFPNDWREPSPAGWGLSLAQLNYQNIWGAPVSLAAHADNVALIISSGLCNTFRSSNPGCAYSSGPNGNVAPMVAVPAPLALERWHELIVHVRWRTDSSGIIEVWHRLQGDSSWNKTVSLRGYPTVQWTADAGPEAIADSVTVDKIGAYRGEATFPLTIWHDGFIRTTSFASAASSLQ